MAVFVNPLTSAADYRQRRLNSILSGEGIHPDIAVGGPQAQSDDGQANRQATFGSAMSDISASGSSQSALYMQAVQRRNQINEEERQRKFLQDQLAKIASTPSGYRGAGKGSLGGSMGGPWNLIPGATSSLQALQRAYKAAGFGNLSVISGGRTYAEQQRLYNLYLQGKGNLAAKPGTSNHESGRAVDFGGAAHSAGTAAHNWLVANAGKYGWTWEGKNFGEPWHFLYTG